MKKSRKINYKCMCEKALKNKKMMKKLGVKMSTLKKNSTFKKNFMKGCVSKLKKILKTRKN